MSEPRLISPMLDGFLMGDPISKHHGVCCCPAIKNETDDKYMVKIISVPATPSQMDALLLSGAYPDEESVLAYYKELTDNVLEEIGILKKLSEQEGFVPYEDFQMEPMSTGKGYDIYLLSPYNRTLERHFTRHSLTHLDALNLGLDLCAALSVCRRSGYLYVDLKPSNVFVTEQLQYRIGSLGFIRLDSLKYASLPEKYRSIYTPAEISDAYAALNATMDIYAAGLILYQAYNNGALPFHDDVLPGDILPAPMYADYEMSEIILKACDPNPDNRWQDPMQMGQAIVSYMQRNGAKDTPIVPLSDASEEEMPDENTDIAENAEQTEPAESDEPKEQAAYIEDEYGNLSFLTDVSYEDLGLSDTPEDYEELSGDVSEILNQADELATLTVPEPVVVPDHIDLPELEPTEPVAEESNQERDVVADENLQPEEAQQQVDEVEDGAVPAQKGKKSHWLRNFILGMLILAVLAGGYWFYTQYYLLPIESVRSEGSESNLTVYVSTSVDESLLEVICVDTYGNQFPACVVEGKAEFTGLVPNTIYNIKVTANGLHRTVGSITTSYSTPIQTNVVQFDAITGATDGSAILSFTIEGPDSKEWTVLYSAEGEQERSATFVSHRVSVTDLTVGKEYTFRLVPADELYLTGQQTISVTARKIAKAENLEVVSCMNNSLTAKWNAPEGEQVNSWTVSCTGRDYNHTVTTSDTTYTFKDLDHTASYTIEVTANYMSVGEKISIAANTVTVTDLKSETTPTEINLTWQTSLPVPTDGWLLHYSIVGIDTARSVACAENAAKISPVVPNATYRFWLTDTSGNLLLSSDLEVATGGSVDFNDTIDEVALTRTDLTSKLCDTLSLLEWDGDDVDDITFASSFSSGMAASVLIESAEKFDATDTAATVMLITRDKNGTPVYASLTNSTWQELWTKQYCKINIPAMPTTAGEYAIEVYFNAGMVASLPFTIT